MCDSDLWGVLFESVAVHNSSSSMCDLGSISSFTDYGEAGKAVLVRASAILALIAVAVS